MYEDMSTSIARLPIRINTRQLELGCVVGKIVTPRTSSLTLTGIQDWGLRYALITICVEGIDFRSEVSRAGA